jgi:hypothetical protein
MAMARMVMPRASVMQPVRRGKKVCRGQTLQAKIARYAPAVSIVIFVSLWMGDVGDRETHLPGLACSTPD